MLFILLSCRMLSRVIMLQILLATTFGLNTMTWELRVLEQSQITKFIQPDL